MNEKYLKGRFSKSIAWWIRFNEMRKIKFLSSLLCDVFKKLWGFKRNMKRKLPFELNIFIQYISKMFPICRFNFTLSWNQIRWWSVDTWYIDYKHISRWVLEILLNMLLIDSTGCPTKKNSMELYISKNSMKPFMTCHVISTMVSLFDRNRNSVACMASISQQVVCNKHQNGKSSSMISINRKFSPLKDSAKWHVLSISQCNKFFTNVFINLINFPIFTTLLRPKIFSLCSQRGFLK